MNLRPENESDTRIFILDDHPIMRSGVRRLIEARAGWTVCGEADSAAAAFDQVQRLAPDVLLADLSLKSGSSGLEFIKNIKALQPALLVLVISMHDERIYAERALRAGAMGYVMKHEAGEKVVKAIERLLDGDMYVAEPVKNKMVRRLVASRPDAVLFPIETLSDRELEVFRLIGDGQSTREIAATLNLSVKTIDSYREHLKLKLDLPDSAALVQHAIQWGRSAALV